MATVLWKFDTQLLSANIGTIRALVTPRSGTTSGYVAFGVVAPNGQVLKTINPSFATSLGATGYDVQFPSITAIESFVTNIALDSLGAYMNGNYTLNCHYIMTGVYPSGGGSPATTDELLTSVAFNLCHSNVPNNLNAGKLTSSPDYGTGNVTITDVTDYTGLTIATHLLTSVNGVTTNTTSNYIQIMPIAAWNTTLKSNVSKTTTTSLSGVSILDIFSITAYLYSPADYVSYKSVLDKAKAALLALEQKQCATGALNGADARKKDCIQTNLLILLIDKEFGYDMTQDINNLNVVLR